jgi:hypothetical protein
VLRQHQDLALGKQQFDLVLSDVYMPGETLLLWQARVERHDACGG